jgi:stearoyl-CoA desaturase (delta-9 desaturase)
MRHLFEHRGWNSGLVQITGMVSIALAICLIWSGVSPWWLALSFPVYVWNNIANSVGFHRLVGHRSFPCPEWLRRVLLVTCTLQGLGSSINWAAAHPAHHKYSDQAGDPHNIRAWWSFLLFWYHYPKYNLRPLVRRLRDPLEGFLHRWYWAIIAGYLIALSLISFKLAFFGHVLPVTVFSILGGIHNVVSHRGDGTRRFPIDVFWYYPFSFSGEWLHGRHHLRPHEWDFSGRYWSRPDPSLPPLRWWQRDWGGEFIRLVQKSGC